MIFTLQTSRDNHPVLLMEDPESWINMIRSTFPSAYIGCWGNYDNCIVLV